MRRRISLYIAGYRVDLSDESFILFNYTMEDLSDPAIVKNSFSQQITLKGTATNNRIFGHIWKSDRLTHYGIGQDGINFDPTQKTPFVIYNEMQEILERGYCKLDEITRDGSMVEYKISLFGGLGAFFFSLAYDSDGNRRTLADLKFTGSTAGASELDFTITASAVRDAWARLGGDTSVSALWDILNFIPAYNGLPGGTFDAGKALVNVEDLNLPVPEGYTTSEGWAIATLADKYTEWEVKDLRSYLQRGVIKFSKVIQAICQDYNNGGYDVILDPAFFNSSNPYYADTWMTLPMINSLNIDIDEGGGLITPTYGRFNLVGGGDMGKNYRVTFGIKPALTIVNGNDNFYRMHFLGVGEERLEVYCNYIEYTLQAYDSNDNLLKTAVVRASTFQANIRIPGAPYIDFVVPNLGSTGVWNGDPVTIALEARGISYVVLSRNVVALAGEYATHTPDANMVWGTGGVYSDNYAVSAYGEQFPAGASSEEYTSSDSVRSGVTISKSMLLSGDKTPADYLLSYGKMFGLVFHLDKTTNTIHILKRENFYNGDTIDLSGRVSIRGRKSRPFTFDAKWYNFTTKYSNGEYAKYYATLYNTIFGVQRVNTGYAFNADAREVMDTMMLGGGCEVLENSKYYCDLQDGNKKVPAVFQDGGKYTLTDGEGKGADFDIPTPALRTSKSWWNDSNKTFDIFPKLQFHNADNAAYEERDTLVFFRGMLDISGITNRIALTDDNPVMLSLNDNTPCWILENQLADPTSLVTDLPMFSRYVWSGDDIVKSLDFGTPQEVAIPDVTFATASSIYEQFWQKYIRDRYDDDSRVMVCKVNLGGYQVNEDLLRNFYYFDGCLWALNRIINHSLSTWDDTECEFIKVQDKDNYTT